MLKKWAIYLVKTIGVVLGLIIITWLVLLVYVNLNEKELTEKVSSLIQKRTKGPVSIGGLSVSFFRTFPILSLQLKQVTVRDSLYSQHKTDLLKASDVYLRASIGGLISGRVPVGKVIVSNGNINLFTDSSGGTNEYVLSSEDRGQSNGDFSMPVVEFRDVEVVLKNIQRGKYYRGEFRSLTCSPRKKNKKLIFGMNMKLFVRNISFNTKTGSYLRDKSVTGKFDVIYAQETKDLLIDNIRLNLDGHPFNFNGKFNLSKKKADFKLELTASQVMYQKATSFMRENLEKKLNEYSVSEPVDLKVLVAGKTSGGQMPLVQASMNVSESQVGTPVGKFDVCSFRGFFTNQLLKDRKRTDENSVIVLKGFTGTWEHILLKSDSIKISNLIMPFIDCDVKSDVDLKSLNGLAGSNSFEFLEGKSSIDVRFKGPIMGNDSSASTIDGDIGIYNASVKYNPRNFTLADCNGKLKFVSNDLEVTKLSARVGKTELVMNGSAKNFLSMMDVSSDKLKLTWNISSPSVHLEDFKPFLSKSEAQKKAEQKKTRFEKAASKIDKLFAEGDMYINLNTPVLEYKTFTATDVNANVVLKTSEIAFDNVELKHAGGTMAVSGSLVNGDRANPVNIRTVMKNMDIPKLFSAFENFGQDAVTHRNLNGKLSADVNFRTAVNNEAKLMSEANEGTVAFLLEQGELNNFEPLMEISKKAFKKQDFTQVKFADLQNRLEVKGTTFIINAMDIRSTALNLTVEGIYDVKKGTDMSIRLPLTNLTSSQADTDITDGGRAKRGVAVRLRARTGEDGKLKISWDPFKRSKKKKEEVQDSTKAE